MALAVWSVAENAIDPNAAKAEIDGGKDNKKSETGTADRRRRRRILHRIGFDEQT